MRALNTIRWVATLALVWAIVACGGEEPLEKSRGAAGEWSSFPQCTVASPDTYLQGWEWDNRGLVRDPTFWKDEATWAETKALLRGRVVPIQKMLRGQMVADRFAIYETDDDSALEKILAQLEPPGMNLVSLYLDNPENKTELKDIIQVILAGLNADFAAKNSGACRLWQIVEFDGKVGFMCRLARETDKTFTRLLKCGYCFPKQSNGLYYCDKDLPY